MEVISTVIQLVGAAILTSLALAVSVYYTKPAYVVHFFLRLSTWRAGCTTKSVKVGEQQFTYMERRQPSKNQPSLLLVHGFAGRKESFCDMITHLPKHLHLIAVDLPRQRDTCTNTKADLSMEAIVAKLHQFVSAVGLDRTPLHVMGQSMGSGLAGCYAALYPDELSLLTMAGPSYIKSPVQGLMFQKVAQGNKHLLVPETVEQAEEMFHICLYNKSLIPPKQLLQGFVDYYMTPYRSFFKECKYKLPLSPPQIMWGRHEQVLHITSLDVIKREMTAPLQVDIIEDSGHSIPVEAPEKAAMLIMNFRDRYVQ